MTISVEVETQAFIYFAVAVVIFTVAKFRGTRINRRIIVIAVISPKTAPPLEFIKMAITISIVT